MYHLLKVWPVFLGDFVNTLMTVGITAVSQAGKRDELLSQAPSKEANEQVQWISAGMLIELEQYVATRL
jgi:hypothetical protein